MRDFEPNGKPIVIAACDPVNLFGIGTSVYSGSGLTQNLTVIRDVRRVTYKAAGEMKVN